jgi:Flp pilus assembly pilin Flp
MEKIMTPSARKKQLGQGMTEYIIIVALIAVAAIAVYQFFGQTIRSQTSGIALEISGRSAQPGVDAAVTASDAALGEGNKTKGLSDYKNDNSRGAKP